MQQDGLKYRCRFCLSLEDAKHATNLFTVEAKHANLLYRPFGTDISCHVDGKRWDVEVVSVGSSQRRRSCIAANCSFLSTISGFPTLLRAYDTACPNAVFQELTAIVLN